MKADLPDLWTSRAATDAQPGERRTGASRKPRLGFLGVGWIGRHRMNAIAASDVAEVVALSDPDAVNLAEAQALAPRAATPDSFEGLLDLELDGLVVATPSALHAEQAEAALARGIAVFCQKPLARTAEETRQVIAAARRADRLLGVDMSYRQTHAMHRIHAAMLAGEIGEVYAVDLVFHNAYGPDKPWFRDPERSGGGCVIDLGIHLVDLALWLLGFPEVRNVWSRLYARGRPLAARPTIVEDHALAQFELENGAMVRLACSWNLAAGRNAVIEARLHGTRGGLSMRNVDGSYYDFVAERFEGTRTIVLASPPDDWGGRAAVLWSRRLASGAGFDPEIESATRVARVLDAIYGR